MLGSYTNFPNQHVLRLLGWFCFWERLAVFGWLVVVLWGVLGGCEKTTLLPCPENLQVCVQQSTATEVSPASAPTRGGRTARNAAEREQHEHDHRSENSSLGTAVGGHKLSD